MVAATSAGGGADLIARLLAARLSAALHQPVIVENRPGANGMVATDAVARAAPDGYTLLLSYTAALLVNPLLRGGASRFDPLRDLAPVAQVGAAGNLLLVTPDVPATDLRQLARHIEEHGDKLGYATWGVGSGGHLAMAQFLKAAGLDAVHVPYTGSGSVASAMLGHSISIGWTDVSSQLQLIKSGRLRAIAVTGTQRLPQLPEVQTMAEQGYPVTTRAWYGLLAPRRTPPDVIAKLNGAVVGALSDPDFKDRLNSLNLPDPPLTTPEEFRALILDDARHWAAILKAARIVAD